MITFLAGLGALCGVVVAFVSVGCLLLWLWDNGIIQIAGSVLFVVALLGAFGYEIYSLGQWVLSL